MKDISLNKKTATFDLCEIGNKIIFSAACMDTICTLDIENRQSHILCRINQKNPFAYVQYKKTVYVNEEIWFFPVFSEKIAIYDLNKVSFLKFNKLWDGIFNEKISYIDMFSSIVPVGDYIYACGFGLPVIMKIDTRSKEIKYIDDWVKEVDSKIINGDVCGFIGDGYYIENNYLYLPVGGSPGLIKLDLKDDSTEIIWINCNMNGFGVMKEHNHKLWFTESRGDTSSILAYDLDTKEIDIFKYNCNYKDIFPFQEMYFFDQKILIIPSRARESFWIDLKNNNVEICDEITGILKEKTDLFSETVVCSKCINNRIYFCTGNDFLWHEYDVEKKDIKSFYIEYDNINIVNNYIRDYYYNRHSILLKENEILLTDYLDMIKSL